MARWGLGKLVGDLSVVGGRVSFMNSSLLTLVEQVDGLLDDAAGTADAPVAGSAAPLRSGGELCDEGLRRVLVGLE